MLEVLDPEQNHAFNDHYLDLDYDLSQTLFIATANNLSGVPKPLLDRMELIYLSGYTEQEKVNIGQQHLIQKAIKANGLENCGLKFDNSALEELIRYFTREAGVRNLEREISSICRKIAKDLLKENTKTPQMSAGQESTAPLKNTPLVLENVEIPLIDAALVQKYLGPRKHTIGEKELSNEVGIGQGLAYTEVGGDLLVTEVAVMSGKGNLKITGKLGDVMQESAQAAFSYVRSRALFLGLEEEFYSKIDIHVHFPEGAIPKDGPSAGITMATALVSALTKKPFSREVAMTGEITLRGRVLPIGGLKEKLLAAHRGGIKKVIIPKENERDLLEIPKNIVQELEIIPVDHMDTVLLHAIAWENEDALRLKLKNAQALSLANVANAKTNQTPIHH
jgi:ATP-dependent Lon protease